MLSELVNVDEDLFCFGSVCNVDALNSDCGEKIERIASNSWMFQNSDHTYCNVKLQVLILILIIVSYLFP